MTDADGYPSHPGEPEGGSGYGQEVAPGNNLVWGILATVFCCLPFGIVSIVKASKVNALWASGAHVQAREAAKDAKKWALIAAGAGLVIALIWVILMVAGVLALDPTGPMEY